MDNLKLYLLSPSIQGHVGIVLAYVLPRCHIIMIENKEESLRRAAYRVQKIGLTNVTLYQSNIDYFCGKFDIGVSIMIRK